MSLYNISGRFGTAITNYFRFIRWLMFMNLYMVVIMIGVTLVPQLILEDSLFIQSQNNTVEECTENYNSYLKNITSREGIGSQILDALQGTVGITIKPVLRGHICDKEKMTLYER